MDLFEGASPAAVGAVIVAYFGAYFLKGAFGFGQLTPSILLAALVLEPHHAVLLAAITSAYSQPQFLPEAVRHGDWTIAKPVALASGASATLGIWIFGRLDSFWLSLILGVALGSIILADLLNLLQKLARHVDLAAPGVVLALSAVAGLITGLTGGGGFFLIALYLKAMCPDPRTFRATALLVTIMIVAWRTLVLLWSGFITVPLMIEGAVLLPSILLGTQAGSAVFRLLPQREFFRLIQALILAAAAALIVKSLV